MERALCGVVLIILGLVILNLLFTMIGMSVVFLHDSRGLFLINDKLLMTFGGIYIPVGFFPETLRLVGETLPTGAATYAAQVFYPDFFDNLPRFIIVQLIWIVLLGWGLYLLSKASDRHMAVNGG